MLTLGDAGRGRHLWDIVLRGARPLARQHSPTTSQRAFSRGGTGPLLAGSGQHPPLGLGWSVWGCSLPPNPPEGVKQRQKDKKSLPVCWAWFLFAFA